jgi:hypothetical protein
MEIEVAFNFIYTMHYNELVSFLKNSLIVNMVHDVNYQLLICWNHYFKVAFYTNHNLLKYIQQFKIPHLYWNELVIFFTSLQLLELNHSLLIY